MSHSSTLHRPKPMCCPSPNTSHARHTGMPVVEGHSSPESAYLVAQLSAFNSSLSTLNRHLSPLNPYARSLTRPHQKKRSLSPCRRSLTNSHVRKSLRAVTYEKVGSRGGASTNKMFSKLTSSPSTTCFTEFDLVRSISFRIPTYVMAGEGGVKGPGLTNKLFKYLSSVSLMLSSLQRRPSS
jgi:hypothetical protein